MEKTENIISNPGFVERGRIIEKNTNKYRVASLDRDGIETDWIKGINNDGYQIDDTVFYFAFRDGTGAILCKFTK